MRISSFVVRMPSLADRKEDIPELIQARLVIKAAESALPLTFEDLPGELISHLTENIPEGNVRGIDHVLERLLVLAPRDRDRKPIFTAWKEIPGVFGTGRGAPAKGDKDDAITGVITLKQLLRSKFDVVTTGFPGLSEFMELIAEKVVQDAQAKHRLNRQAAAALKVSESALSMRLKATKKRHELRAARRSQAKQTPEKQDLVP